MTPNATEQTTTGETVKTPVLCPKCGADVTQIGFVIVTTHRNAYTPGTNGLVKSHKAKSYEIGAYCPLCGTLVTSQVEPLIEKKA